MSLKSGAASADKLVDVFLNNSFIRAAAITSIAVGGYMPIGSEINCVPLLKAMFDGGVNICLPIIQNKGATLLFRGWEPDDDMHLNSLGVPEPLPSASLAIPDVLLVPMLAFDLEGNRLGYGGGYYDNTIRSLRAKNKLEGKPLIIGVAFSGQLSKQVSVSSKDEPLDWILTEIGAIKVSEEVKEV